MNSAALKERVLQAARARPSPTRAGVDRQAHVLFGATVAVFVGMFAALGGVHLGHRTWRSFWFLAALRVPPAVWGARSLFQGKDGAWGPSSTRMLAVAVGLPLWLAVTSLFAAPVLGVPDGRLAALIDGVELCLLAMPPTLAWACSRASSEPTFPALRGAAMGALLGGFAFLAVCWRCGNERLPHVLLGHGLPMFLCIAFGAAVGERLMAPRWVPVERAAGALRP